MPQTPRPRRSHPEERDYNKKVRSDTPKPPHISPIEDDDDNYSIPEPVVGVGQWTGKTYFRAGEKGAEDLVIKPRPQRKSREDTPRRMVSAAMGASFAIAPNSLLDSIYNNPFEPQLEPRQSMVGSTAETGLSNFGRYSPLSQTGQAIPTPQVQGIDTRNYSGGASSTGETFQGTGFQEIAQQSEAVRVANAARASGFQEAGNTLAGVAAGGTPNVVGTLGSADEFVRNRILPAYLSGQASADEVIADIQKFYDLTRPRPQAASSVMAPTPAPTTPAPAAPVQPQLAPGATGFTGKITPPNTGTGGLQDLPHRSFEEIQATGYQTDEERAWFLMELQRRGSTLGQDALSWLNQFTGGSSQSAPPRPAPTAQGGVFPETGRSVTQITGTSYLSDAERAWYLAQVQANPSLSGKPAKWSSWGENVTNNGQVFGALGNTPYQGQNTFPPEVEQWRATVVKYFRPEDVNKALYIIMKESGGRNVPQTGGGPARGLFQIELGAGRPTEQELLDPEFNIKYAAGMTYS